MADDAPPARAAVFLLGATGSGKSDLALALAERLPVDIISVDSALVYRGMDIGTAKPPLATRLRIPHALVDIRDPEQPYSAAEFCVDAERLMRASWARGRTPLLVGGTMLYFRALRDGLATLPPADDGLRRQLQLEASSLGWPSLHARLTLLDPEAGARLAPNDSQRVARALEVVLLTGVPLAQWWRRQRNVSLAERLGCSVANIVVGPRARRDLDARLQTRFEAMLAAGLIAEVETLRARPGVHADLPAMKSVGYRQAWMFLNGAISQAAMCAQAVTATRALAKRQYTWLRRWQVECWAEGSPEQVREATLQYLATVPIVTAGERGRH